MRSPLRKLQVIRKFSNSSLEGLWVFHRHGDRTPNRFLLAEHRYDEEAEFWLSKVPPTDMTHYEWLREKIPTRIHKSNNGGIFLDASRTPYGYLTWKGMNQMYQKGCQFAMMYHGNNETPITDIYDINAFSTNYLRTVKSCQCFLDGLLSKLTTSIFRGNSQHYENVIPENFQESRHHDVSIEVRDRTIDTLNAFDKDPDLMKQLVGNVVNTAEFLERDIKAATLAARLISFLPGLLKSKSFGGGSGINWIHASDHFVCRSSHEIPFSKFSNLEYDPNTEVILKGMHHSTLAHLSWRFRMWYQSIELLSAIAGPPLAEILRQIETASGNIDTSKRKPFTIYSCHDVTILAILYGLNATFLASEKDLFSVGITDAKGENRWRYWPDYASTLAIELHRFQNENGGFDHKLRIRLNNDQISTINAIKHRDLDMSLDTFQEQVLRLQRNDRHIEKEKIQSKGGGPDLVSWTD